MEAGKKWRVWIEKKGFRKWFQRDNLIILILFGVLLMIIALPVKDGGDSAAGWDQSEGAAASDRSGAGGQEAAYEERDWLRDLNLSSGQDVPEEVGLQETEDGAMAELKHYGAFLEQRLTQLLNGMEGVGKVSVMISMQSTRELVLEKDQPVTRSHTVEQDGEGGSRNSYQVDSGESTVYAGQGSGQVPYVIKTLAPKVKGVVVSAQGAGIARISNDITEVVQALFGLEANQVKVIRMKSSD